MSIRVYPSFLDGEPLETHRIDAPTTILAWLKKKVANYDHEAASKNISIFIDGEHVSPDDWHSAAIAPKTSVRIVAEPKGAVGVVIVTAVIVAAATYLALRGINNRSADASRARGRSLDSGDIDANRVAFGDPIPEIAGSPKVYPIYLLPPRRFYVSERQQWIEAFFCVGAGRYEKSVADVHIGNTPASEMGGNVAVQFHEPGANVSGDPASQWWHEPKEVGFTSLGASGLKLGASVDVGSMNWGANVFTFSGQYISVESGETEVPSDWHVGLILRILSPYSATFTVEGDEFLTINVISGNAIFQTYSPSVGDEITVNVDGNNTNTTVIDYEPGTPGTPTIIAGVGDVARLDFGDNPASMTINIAGVPVSGPPFNIDYDVDLDDNYASIDDLVSDLNVQLAAAALHAERSGDRVNIIADGNQGINQFSASGDAVPDVFGAGSTTINGTIGTPSSASTISTLLNNRITGVREATIGYRGLRYRITEIVDSRTIRVQQLNASGNPVSGWGGFAQLTSSEGSVSVDTDELDGAVIGPYVGNPEGRLVDAFEVDIFAPQGLIRYNSKGRAREVSVRVFIEWRELGTTNWTRISRTYRRTTADQIGFTERINLPRAMQLEVRLQRDGAPSDDNQTYDALQWNGFRCRVVDAPARYEGMTTMSVRMRSGDRISGNAENRIWLKPTRILPLVHQPSDAPTRDIAPWVLHVLRTSGYPDSWIDIDEFQRLDTIWRARGDTFDHAYIEPSTVKTVVNESLRPGFSEMTIAGGRVTPVRDVWTDQRMMALSDQEFTRPLQVTTTLPQPDEIDGVDAEYFDRDTGQIETVEYRLPGDLGLRAEKIRLIGVSEYSKAFQLAARHRRERAYRRTTYSGSTEQHLRLIPYLAPVGIVQPLPGYAYSSFVVDVKEMPDGRLVITSAEPLGWIGDDAVVAFRRDDGSLYGPVPAIPAYGREYRFIIEKPAMSNIRIHSGTPTRQATVFYFGKEEKLFHSALITSIEPNEEGIFSFKAMNNDPRVYADDEPDPEV